MKIACALKRISRPRLARRLALSSVSCLLLATAASAKKVIVGTGSGQVLQTSMGTLVAGDTLAITAGTYAGGGQFGGLNNITIINDGGAVTFTAPVDFGAQGASMTGVTWTGTGSAGSTYGFVFDATGAYGTGPVGYTTNGGLIFTAQHYVQVRLDHTWFKGLVGNAFDLTGVLPTYDGTTSSLGIYRATFSYCRADNTSEFYQGPYKTPNFGFADSVDISYNILSQTSGDGETVNAEMTNYNIHHNQVLYSGYNALASDVGAFCVTGFGQIHHNYMKGGRGWLARISGCSFKGGPVGTFYGYDNIKLGTTTYGMFDLRSDSLAFFAPVSNFFQHCNFEVAANTIGNLTANDANGTGSGNGYNTPVALFYVMDGGSTGLVKDNLGFNSVIGGSGGYIAISFATSNGVGLGFTRIDTSNNRYFTAQTILNVLSDTNANCALKPGAPLIGAGLALPFVTTDYSGRTRANPPSVGAEEFSSSASAVLANAGSGQAITLPLDSVSLSGAGSTVTGSTISSYNWSQISGPGTASFSSATSVTTRATKLVAGTYVFGLKVKDANHDSSSATVAITVNAADQPPTVSAGPNQAITLPTSSVTLTGTATDPLGIGSYLWAETSGPGTATLSNKSSASTAVSGLLAGTYVFSFTATDSKGLATSSTVTVTVGAAAGKKPISVTVTAQPASMALPKSATTLACSVTDPALSSPTYTATWSQRSGPGTARISSPSANSTKVSGLVAGTYVFSVTVKDPDGTASGTVTVSVGARARTYAVVADSARTAAPPKDGADAGPTDPAPLTVAPGKGQAPVTDGMGLYPDPVTASATLVLKGPATGKVLLNIYDVAGRLQWSRSCSKPPEGASLLLDLQLLRPGAYILRAIVADRPWPAIKFIKL